MDADGNNLPLIHYLPHDQSSVGSLDIGFPGNLLCSKSSLKVIPYNQGNLWNNQTSLYTRSNPPIWATWRSKGFRIHPHLAEKMGTLLFWGTLGHTVGEFHAYLPVLCDRTLHLRTKYAVTALR